MSRDLTAGALTETAAAALRPVVFYEGEYVSGTLRLWSGVGSIDWNGHTWTGAGSLLGIAEVTETADLKAAGWSVSLSGVSTALIAVAMAEAQLGQDGLMWFGFIDAAGAVVVDPYLAFQGRLDVPVIEDGGETCTIAIQYESRLVDLERPRLRRWTAEDAKIDYPDEAGFDYVPGLPQQVLRW